MPARDGVGALVVDRVLDADARRHDVRRLLLVERLAVDAVREALHHQRPLGDDRQQPRRHARVEAEQVALGVAVGRPEHLAQVGDLERLAAGQRDDAVLLRVLHLLELRDQGVELRRRGDADRARRRRTLRRRRRQLALGAGLDGLSLLHAAPHQHGALRRRAGLGRLRCRHPRRLQRDAARIDVVAQPQVHGVTQVRLVGPAGERDLGDQLRLDPVDRFVGWHRAVERRAIDGARAQHLRDARQLAIGEAAADVADVAQLRVGRLAGERAEHQRAEVLARLARLGPAADDQRLDLLDLQLDPRRAAPIALVARVGVAWRRALPSPVRPRAHRGGGRRRRRTRRAAPPRNPTRRRCVRAGRGGG